MVPEEKASAENWLEEGFEKQRERMLEILSIPPDKRSRIEDALAVEKIDPDGHYMDTKAENEKRKHSADFA